MAVRKIAFPNNGGPCPDGEAPRVETGAVQFGEDWPGLFVRGDEAFHLALYVGYVKPFIKAILERQGIPALGTHDWDHLDTAMSKLSEISRIINEEVRV